MPETHIKTEIQRALNNFMEGELAENATHLLKVLGYQSQRTLNRDANTAEAFLEDFDPDNQINPEKAHLHEWQTVDFLFQLTADEIRQQTQETITLSEWSALGTIIFDALDLTQGEPDGVYEAVVNLVEARLRKAKSVKRK